MESIEKLDYRAMTSARGGRNRRNGAICRGRDPFSYPPFSHWFAIWRARETKLPPLSVSRLNSIENFDCQHLFPRLSRNNLKRGFFFLFFFSLPSLRVLRVYLYLRFGNKDRGDHFCPWIRLEEYHRVFNRTRNFHHEDSEKGGQPLFSDSIEERTTQAFLPPPPPPFFLFESIGRFSEGSRDFELSRLS